jgi:hypothetical protein
MAYTLLRWWPSVKTLKVEKEVEKEVLIEVIVEARAKLGNIKVLEG